MLDVLSAAIAPVNLPFTVLLGLVLLYWISVTLGFFDLSLLQPDFDADLSAAANGEGAAGPDDAHAPSALSSLLVFLNLDRVPTMVVLSFFALTAWIISMLTNAYLTGGSSLLAFALLLPNIIVSALAAKLVTQPMRPLFRALMQDPAARIELVGRTCRVLTGEADERFGQAEVEIGGAPAKINIRTRPGETLRRGDHALVIAEDKERRIFIVAQDQPSPLEK